MKIASTKAWALIGVLAAAVVLAVGWTLLISPARQHVAEVQDEVSSQASTNATAADAVARLKKQSSLLDGRRAQMEALAVTIPKTAQIPTLVRDINNAAALSGVTLDQVTPASPVPVVAAGSSSQQKVEGGLQEIAVSIAVTGTYAQTRNFLVGLEAMKRGVLVHGLDMVENAGGAAGTFKTTIRAGVFLNPDLGTRKAASTATNPSATNSDTTVQADTPS